MLRALKSWACLECLAGQQQQQQQTLGVLPNARGLPVLGALVSIIKSSGGARLHEYIDAQHRRYGGLFRGQIGPVKAVFVGEPDAVRQMYSLEGAMPRTFVPEAWTLYNQRRQRARGLLFMNGEEWQINRRVMSKIMLSQESVDFTSKPCAEAASDLVENWKQYANGQIVPDLENQLYKWSIEVILATLVGEEAWPAYRARVLPELGPLSRRLIHIFDHSVELSRLPAWLAERLRLPAWRGFASAADHCFDGVDRLLDEAARLPPAGLLARMADAGLDEPTRRRIVVDLVFAAGDTTAFALQWLLFLLAGNPGVQDELYQRLQGLDQEEVLREPLLRGAIRETLRLYPIAPFVARTMPRDNYLDRFLVKEGELVVMSLYTCGRSEESFPRAQEFRPERWLRGPKGEYAAVARPHGSLPFSMGAKSCIGKKLAESQLSLAAAELLRNFRIDCLNKDDILIRLRLITAPSQPLQLTLTPRN